MRQVRRPHFLLSIISRLCCACFIFIFSYLFCILFYHYINICLYGSTGFILAFMVRLDSFYVVNFNG